MTTPRKLRILAIHRYFWPDSAPYGAILYSIVRRWAADGHDVDVLTTQPSYGTAAGAKPLSAIEQTERLRIRRLTLLREKRHPTVARLLNIAAWTVIVFFYAARRRFDIVMISTNPPVVAAMAARYAAKLGRARLLYHCMDIHPEIGRVSGEFRNRVIFNSLRSIDTRTCLSADRVIVLSKDMQDALRARPGLSQLPITVINNFDVSERDDGLDSLPNPLGESEGRMRVIFTGNAGRFQGLEAVIDAFLQLGGEAGIEMVFVGNGTAVAQLQARSGKLLGQTIHFYPHQPMSVVRKMLRSSDICLVCLAPEISYYAYPCKTMTYLSESRPLLVCAEPDSELAELVRENGIGLTVEPGDSSALAKALNTLSTDPDRYHEIASRARALAPRLFVEEEILDRWTDLIVDF